MLAKQKTILLHLRKLNRSYPIDHLWHTQYNAINCYKERWTCARCFLCPNHLSQCFALTHISLCVIWKHILISISYLSPPFFAENVLQKRNIKFSSLAYTVHTYIRALTHTHSHTSKNSNQIIRKIPLTAQTIQHYDQEYKEKIGFNGELKRQPTISKRRRKKPCDRI